MIDPAALVRSLQLPDGAMPDHVFLRRWAWERGSGGRLEVLSEDYLSEEDDAPHFIQVPQGRRATLGWADGVAVVLAYKVAMSAGEVEVVVDVDGEVAPLIADLIGGLLGVPVSSYDGLR